MKKVLSLFMVALLAFTLMGCKPDDSADKALVQEAAEGLLIESLIGDQVVDAVVTGFPVPTSLRNNVSASWASSDAEHAEIKDRGKEGENSVLIFRPNDANKAVTLTATLKLNNVTETVELKFTVAKLPEGTLEFSTIAALRTAAKESSAWTKDGFTGSGSGMIASFKLTGVTVVNLDQDAYHVVDDAGDVLMVFQTPDVVLGDKGNLIGAVDAYYYSLQATGATFELDEEGVTVTPANVSLNTYDFKDKKGDDLQTAKTDSAYIKYMKFDAYVVLRSDFTGGANYELTLVDPTNGKDFDKGFVLSYYKGTKHADLMKLVGKEVTITATVRELRDSRATTAGNSQPVWSFSIATIVTKGDMPAATLAAVDAKGISITTDFPETEPSTYDLPAAAAEGGFGSTFVWSVVSGADNASIDGTKLSLTPTAGKRNEVVLKVVATLSGETAEREITIMVGDYVDYPIATILGDTVPKAETVRVDGIVTFIVNSTYGNMFISDGEGNNIYIYGSYASGVFAGLGVKVGDKVQLIGTKDVYNGLGQVRASQCKILSSGADVPAAVEITTLAGAVDNISGLVKLTGVVSELANNVPGATPAANLTFKVTIDDQVFAVRASANTIKVTGLADGSNVTITAFVGYYQSGYTGVAQGSTGDNIQISLYAATDVVVNAAE